MPQGSTALTEILLLNKAFFFFFLFLPIALAEIWVHLEAHLEIRV